MNGDVSVEVGGDVPGQLIVGDYSVAVTAHGSTVTINQSGPPPRPALREPLRLLPHRPTDAPLGREVDGRAVLDAIRAGGPVQIHGPRGVGKSTLLRQVAHGLVDEPADGGSAQVLFLDVAGQDLMDIQQDLFEACYETRGYAPSPVERRWFMQQVHCTAILDNLECAPEQLGGLLDSLPAGVALFTTDDPYPLGEGRSHLLRGLEQDAAVELLGRLLGGPLAPDDIPGARGVWRMTGGLPRYLVAAAAGSVRSAEGTDGPIRWPIAAELPGLLAHLLDDLDPPARRALSLLVLVGSVGVDADLVTLLLRAVERDAATGPTAQHPEAAGPLRLLDALAASGLVEQTDRGYRAIPEILHTAAQRADLQLTTVELLRACTTLTAWAADPLLPPTRLAAHAPLIAGIAAAATAAGHPDAATLLTRTAAPGAARALRPGAWQQVLDQGLNAATAAKDRPAQAYFHHERGIRLLLIGSALAAAAALATAAALWTETGHTALAHTAHAANQLAHGIATHGAATHTATGTAAIHGAAASPATTQHAVAAGAKMAAGSSGAGHSTGMAGALASLKGSTLAIAAAATAAVVTTAAVVVTQTSSPAPTPPPTPPPTPQRVAAATSSAPAAVVGSSSGVLTASESSGEVVAVPIRSMLGATSQPLLGPDGRIWLIDGLSLEAFDPTTYGETTYSLDDTGGASVALSQNIAFDGSGNLWVGEETGTGQQASFLLRYTPSTKKVTKVALNSACSGQASTTSGDAPEVYGASDGAVWAACPPRPDGESAATLARYLATGTSTQTYVVTHDQATTGSVASRDLYDALNGLTNNPLIAGPGGELVAINSRVSVVEISPSGDLSETAFQEPPDFNPAGMFGNGTINLVGDCVTSTVQLCYASVAQDGTVTKIAEIPGQSIYSATSPTGEFLPTIDFHGDIWALIPGGSSHPGATQSYLKITPSGTTTSYSFSDPRSIGPINGGLGLTLAPVITANGGVWMPATGGTESYLIGFFPRA